MKRLIPAFTVYVFGMALFAGCVGPGGYRQTPPQTAGSGAPGNAQFVYSDVRVVSGAPQSAGLYHTVAPGETLYRISKAYDVPVADIMKANQLKDPTHIQKGQSILIPGIGPAVPAATTPHNFPTIPLFPNNGHWRYIVIHHTATKDGDMAFIDKVHRARGFGELGYHFIIDNGTRGRKNGEIEIGNRWYNQKDGAHAKADNMNHKSIGISLMGNFSEDQVSQEQLDSLAYLVNTLRTYYRIPKWRVIRHRDVHGAATECPGNYFPWSRFRKMLD